VPSCESCKNFIRCEDFMKLGDPRVWGWSNDEVLNAVEKVIVLIEGGVPVLGVCNVTKEPITHYIVNCEYYVAG